MSDRNVREPAQALAQRLTRLEDKVRAMSLRTWPGAIRTSQADAVNLLGTDDEILSLTATAGRWVVFAEATAVIAAPTLLAAPVMQVAVFDPTTGDELSGGDVDLPARHHLVYTTDPVELTLSTFGHFVADMVVTVRLSMSNDGGDDMTADRPRLLLLPV